MQGGGLGKKVEKRTCRNQLIRTLPSTEPERIAVRGEVEDLPAQIDSTDMVSARSTHTALWTARVESLTPGSPLYALNFCERRPSGTRLSATSGARWKRSAVRALSLRLSDDRSGASGDEKERTDCGSVHQLRGREDVEIGGALYPTFLHRRAVS